MDPQLALTTDMKIVLGLVGLTMVLFVFQRVRADLVALVVLVMLGLTGLVQPEDLFNGFSSNAVISVIATMILGMGLDRTGALNRLAAWLLRRARGMEDRLLLLVCEDGSRATSLTRTLHAAGFTKVFNLRGGLATWRAEGLPLKRG